MGNRNYLLDPGSRFAQVREQGTHMIVQTCFCEIRTVHNAVHYRHRPHNSNRTVVYRPGSEHAPSQFLGTEYSASYQNCRIRTVLRRLVVTYSSMAAYNIGTQPLCSRCTCYRCAYRICVVCSKLRFCRMLHNFTCAHRRTYF